ncbi:MAG: PAS domain S-box protein, partial [Anaerolineales bacterium]|nr:PAS domain S-box protein [Anaerolineales bacterium]
RDITERKRAEAALRAGEARYRSLVEAQADLVMRADPQFRVTFVNDAFCRTFNRTPAQILGQPVVDQVPPSEHTVVLARLAALNEPPYQSSGENRNLTAAGERWFAWANTAIRDEAGRVVEYQMVGRDVTEQRAAAAALQESEARYRSLVESATDGIILMDAAERILVFNPAAERIFGYAAAEILGQSVRRLMPAEHGAHHSASVQHHLATGQATLVGRTAQLTGRRRNGEAFPLELSLSSVATADGPIFTSIIRDISERRRLEAAAQASEARFRQLFEAMQEGFALHEVICDAAGRPVDYRFLDVNPAFAALTGLEREQVVGRTVLEVLPETEPYWIETYGRVAQTGESVRLQNFSRALDRRYEVIAFRPAPGQFATIVADITERQKTEAALRLQGAALNAAADGIVITDPAGVIQWVNPAYTRLTGYPAEAALGQNPRLLKSGRHDQAFYRELWATIKAGHTWQGEIINRRQDGRLYEEEQTITPVLDEAGQITHFVAIKRDISARKQRERELASLAQVSAALRVAAGRAEMPPIILDQLAQLLQVRGAALALRDEAGDQPGLQLAQGNWVDFTQLRLPPDEALLRHVLETGQAYQCDDVRADPRFYQGLPLREQFAVACVPLIAQQAVIGVLWAARQWPFQEAEARVLASVADIAASALHRATLHAQTQHRAEQLAEVSAAGQVLAEILDPEQVYDRLHQIIMRLFPDSGIVFISLYEAERQQISAAFGMEGGRRLEVADLPPLPLEPQGIQSEVILTRRPLIVDDLPARLAGVQHQHIVGDASQLPRSALYVPMLARGRVVGVIQLQSHRARRYSAMEAELLTVVANTAAVALENARLFAEVRRRLEQLQALHRVDQAIASSQDARLTLSVLLTQLVAQTGADAADLLVLNPGQQTLEYLAGLGFHGRPFTEPLPLAEDSRAAQAVLERRLAHLPDLAAQPLADPRGAVLAREGFVTYLAAPLVAQGQVKGVLELFHRSAYRADAERLAVLDLFAGQAAIAVENAELFLSLQRSNADLRQAYDATIEGWSRALDMRDKETEGHTRRVTEITLRLARAMGLDDDALIHVRRGALLHDIGKMGVPDGILLKPGPLTAEEWVVMRQHPQYAHDMLAPIAFLRPALEIPYCHHEKWDGSGYPRGLAGEAIPLAARIFAVVDVWDALNSDRPYRPAWPAERIRAHIRGEAGRHFDPRVVETFLRLTL